MDDREIAQKVVVAHIADHFELCNEIGLAALPWEDLKEFLTRSYLS